MRLAEDLLADPKERSEHVMLVDLGRNDLGRVCRPGTVDVVEFMDVRALELFRQAGQRVEDHTVFLDPDFVLEQVAKAPREFDIQARNPANTVHIGGDAMAFGAVYGPPFVRDAEGGRRYATIEDFRNFVKLGYMSKWLHHSGGTVCEPTDVAVNKRHLDMLHAHMTLSDKPFMGSVTHPMLAQDTVDMARIVFGAELM